MQETVAMIYMKFALSQRLLRNKLREVPQIQNCQTRFRKGNRMHPIYAPGSSSTDTVDFTSVYRNNIHLRLRPTVLVLSE
jgi:hypothetical protein